MRQTTSHFGLTFRAPCFWRRKGRRREEEEGEEEEEEGEEQRGMDLWVFVWNHVYFGCLGFVVWIFYGC